MRAVTPMTMSRREANRQDFCQITGSARVQGRRTPNRALGPGCKKIMSTAAPQHHPDTRYGITVEMFFSWHGPPVVLPAPARCRCHKWWAVPTLSFLAWGVEATGPGSPRPLWGLGGGLGE